MILVDRQVITPAYVGQLAQVGKHILWDAGGI